MLYSLIRPILFRLDPENAHGKTLNAIDMAYQLGLLKLLAGAPIEKPVTCMGLTFKNSVGLAAGLDKNGDHINALAALGFGSIEIGTITPRPQSGNPKPRMFRLPQAEAIINRMGFNNHGVDALIANVEKAKYSGVLGINIGKNADTPVENATHDYLKCMEKVYAYASYITMNISSPNTQGLRSLQTGDALTQLLDTLKNKQAHLSSVHGKYVPLVLKVAPDLDESDIDFISQQLLQYKIDGLITTNTTLDRHQVVNLVHGSEAGGLSGRPVFEKSTACLKQFSDRLQGQVALIGVGGIDSAATAKAKIDTGAQLVQIYSGLIYKGPDLIRECASVL